MAMIELMIVSGLKFRITQSRVGTARLIGMVLLVAAGLCHHAQADDAAPPARVAPLESERIRPEPTPGLQVPTVPGTQTVVLREYVPTLRPDQAIPPVALHVPDKYFAKLTGRPAEVWGLNLIVRYPTMEPLRSKARACAEAWCGDEILLHLEIDRTARSQMRADMNKRRVAIAERDSSVSVSPGTLPSDYNEAYRESFIKRRPPEEELVYLKNDHAGQVTEYVECFPNAPNPICTFFFSFPELSDLQIEYTASMKYWESRGEMRLTVYNLVKSFSPARTNKGS